MGADERATALVAAHGSIDASLLTAATAGGTPAGAVAIGDRFISEDAATGQIGMAVALANAYHRDHPLRPGIPASSLASQLGIDRRELNALLVESGDELVDDGATIRTSEFEPQLSDADEAAWSEARATLAASLAVPRASQLGIDDEVLHAVVRRGELVQVDADLVFLPDQIDRIVSELDGFDEPFTVSEFRESLGLSRRQAVPLLEWLDRSGRTIRDRDVRTVRRTG